MMTKKDKEMQKLKEYCELKKKLVDYLKGDHPMPKTRREFLQSGLITMTTAIAAPTLMQLISSSAWAQSSEIQCESAAGGGGTTATRPLFVHVQLAGGPALYAQYAAAGGGGDPLNSQNVGRGANAGRTNRFSNNAPFYTNSRFLQGMDGRVGGANSDIYTNGTFVGVAAGSLDDTSSNRQDVSGMLAAAGIIGEKLQPTIATGQAQGRNLAGNRFRGAVFDSANRLRVSGSNSLEGALTIAGSLGNLPGNADAQRQLHVSLVSLIEDLTASQVRELASNPNSHESQKKFKNLIQCAAKKNVENMSEGADINFLDNNTPSIANTGDFQNAFQNAQSIGQACGAGFAGLTNSVTISMGGYDYHNGTSRATAEQRDEDAGSMVGRILAGARAAGKPVFIYVSADGSVGSNRNDNGTQNWSGDLGTRGMAYMISYDPSGPTPASPFNQAGANYADASHQLNHFNVNAAAQMNPIGSLNSSATMASAVFLNYLNVIGQANLIDSAGLAPVKSLLSNQAPTGVTIQDYFTRLKPKAS